MTLRRVGKKVKDEIRKQISLARNSTDGELDDRNQVEWYPGRGED